MATHIPPVDGGRIQRNVITRVLRNDSGNQHDATPRETPEPDSAHAEVRAGIPVDVHRARLADLAAVGSFSHEFSLNFPDCSPNDAHPRTSILKQALPFWVDDRHLFVAQHMQTGQVLGMVQFQQVSPDLRWIATHMATNVGALDDDPVIIALLHHAIQEAGLAGVRRLYARAERDAPWKEPMLAMGFACYGQETVFVAPNVPATSVDHSVRRQEQSDVWAIHQLYMRTTPVDVQRSEALTSHSWDVRAPQRRTGSGCRGWCVMHEHLAIAFAQAVTHRDGHVLELMYDPDHRTVLPGLISTALHALSALPARPVFVVIRDYQEDASAVLERVGLHEHVEQELLVRYTTASVRSSVVTMESHVLEGAPETVTKRVPTYCRKTSPHTSS